CVFRHLSDEELHATLAAELRFADDPVACPAEMRAEVMALVGGAGVDRAARWRRAACVRR
ncbi:MAG: hypothetical protein AVDCRST_MAG04-3871, partial [uncultured Acetobacteraceae bacterium]